MGDGELGPAHDDDALRQVNLESLLYTFASNEIPFLTLIWPFL